MAQRGAVAPVPVLCVGNLVAGGAGKTPTALALAADLQARGHRPAFLSRGYGRRIGPGERGRVIRVDAGRDRAEATGDEPLLLAAVAPTYVSADRRAAADQAAAEGATVLILDDGLQNPRLAKTLSIAVVDGATGLGNGFCLPAGPLRAPASRQWPFIQALCVIGAGVPGDAAASAAASHGIPVLWARLHPDPGTVSRLAGRPLLAFAGIGRPEKFFATLREHGLVPRAMRSFPDHHPFTAAERAGLMAEAKALGATLVTTAKDRARLPPEFPVEVLPVSLAFDAPDGVKHLLDGVGHPKSTA